MDYAWLNKKLEEFQLKALALGIEEGRRRERADVVAWLLQPASDDEDEQPSIQARIERGDHEGAADEEKQG